MRRCSCSSRMASICDGSEAESGAACGFSFDGAELVLAAIELDAGEFVGLAVFGDGDVLLGEIFEQVFAASARLPEPRMMRMTSSRWSRAIW